VEVVGGGGKRGAATVTPPAMAARAAATVAASGFAAVSRWVDTCSWIFRNMEGVEKKAMGKPDRQPERNSQGRWPQLPVPVAGPPAAAAGTRYRLASSLVENASVWLKDTVSIGGTMPRYRPRTTPSPLARKPRHTSSSGTSRADGAVCMRTRKVSMGWPTTVEHAPAMAPDKMSTVHTPGMGTAGLTAALRRSFLLNGSRWGLLS
jgi:hypothetical protein